ncbi:hypothetical protein [Streptomyces sp. N50]|uniref:hypothetical protein n=1 Tax=Streptomyces sp. N50 TaxID=3081765 RepID=UPI0029621E4A|nr:hypothetical protein [Streptomyces sp. N50]WOX15427.1 hypothetical protein R2B38_44170 [Streptomyces sp. N50]
MTHTITHWCGGRSRAGTSSRSGEVSNPATGEATARVALSSADEKASLFGDTRAYGEESVPCP